MADEIDPEVINSKQPRKPVKFLLERANWSDPLYGTGAWAPGETKLVPVDVALKMLKHFDVWGEATPKEASESTAEVVLETAKKDEDESAKQEEQAYRDNLNAMPKDTLIEFVKVHYGQTIAKNATPETARVKANQLVDQFGPR